MKGLQRRGGVWRALVATLAACGAIAAATRPLPLKAYATPGP
jgi:hypothetical protein